MMLKHVTRVVAVIALAAGVAYCASAIKVVVEAEKYTKITPSMKKTASANASGGYFIEIPVRRPHAQTEGAPADTGSATYTVKIPSAGVWQFWGRSMWYDACGNSFFVKIGGNPAVQFGQDGTYGRWHWVKGPKVNLPAGNVQVVVQNREDGAKLDQFLFTKNLRYVPVRAEK